MAFGGNEEDIEGFCEDDTGFHWHRWVSNLAFHSGGVEDIRTFHISAMKTSMASGSLSGIL